ncbi:hypothetical protein QAD02_013450 [Eretmocerus hayati]|uniref:Uncharacterized protein n=1 Tax=Eretmocerus hayati TaxID=131215 RepID=A0ACC2P2G4_9HYME|nr:hypothetical protein QAD02_013450 [Eretmocerus hayati]
MIPRYWPESISFSVGRNEKKRKIGGSSSREEIHNYSSSDPPLEDNDWFGYKYEVVDRKIKYVGSVGERYPKESKNEFSPANLMNSEGNNKGSGLEDSSKKKDEITDLNENFMQEMHKIEVVEKLPKSIAVVDLSPSANGLTLDLSPTATPVMKNHHLSTPFLDQGINPSSLSKRGNTNYMQVYDSRVCDKAGHPNYFAQTSNTLGLKYLAPNSSNKKSMYYSGPVVSNIEQNMSHNSPQKDSNGKSNFQAGENGYNMYIGTIVYYELLLSSQVPGREGNVLDQTRITTKTDQILVFL